MLFNETQYGIHQFINKMINIIRRENERRDSQKGTRIHLKREK